MSARSESILQEVDFLVAELQDLSAAGPHFEILHQYRIPGTDCAPGEEIAVAKLLDRGRTYLLPLSLTLLLLFDYLAHHSHLPQTASQITAGMRAAPFYQRHGANAATHVRLTRKISLSSIKVYIERLRSALQQTFTDAQMRLDPCCVLVSRQTSSNQVGYQLLARFEWIHIDHPDRKLIWP
jgi:hypothetical protein